MWNCLLVDGSILLDMPPTAIPMMHRLGIDPPAIDVVFISHHHADHSFGLPFFLLEYCFRYERTEPLHIVGPPRIEELTDQICDLAWPNMRSQGFEPNVPLRFIEVCEEGEYEAGDLRFLAKPMAHFDLEALGYRFEHKGRTIAYTGDTGDCAAVCRLIEGADIAIVELTHDQTANDPGHLDVEEVTRLTEDLRREGAVVLATHMGGKPKPIDGITLCEDGKTYYV